MFSGAITVQAQSHYEPYFFGRLAGNAPGSDDGIGGAARFFGPESVAVDQAGNVYVSDYVNSTIRKITPAGVVSTLAGLAGSLGHVDGTGGAARFSYPIGIAVDLAGNVYVGDGKFVRKITPAGVVTTIAGSASGGSADGIGSAAGFENIWGIAQDNSGNIYLADFYNHNIRKITPDRVVTTLAGLAGHAGTEDGTGSAARFAFPGGVAVDSQNNVYVGDHSHTIRKITSDGVVTTLAGLKGSAGSDDGIGNAARFFYPVGIAVDSADNLYVADSYNATIRKITPAGLVTTVAGSAGNTGSDDGLGSAARFVLPQGVAIDKDDNLYVADTFANTVRKITPDRIVSTMAGLPADENGGSADGIGGDARFAVPAGVAGDSAGNIYVADSGNQTIRKVTPTGVVSTLAGLARSVGNADGTGDAARFNYPEGVAVDSHDNIYVADTNNSMIRKVTPAGFVTTLAGSPGSGNTDGTGSAARFSYPRGLAVDTADNIFVADTLNDTIRKVTPDGVVTTVAGLGMNGVWFDRPSGVAVDGSGNVYVADTSHSMIRKIAPSGVVSTLAGSLGGYGSADGSGSGAHFTGPEGVAVDNAENVYVTDTGNHTIRKITPAGIVTTIAGSPGSVGNASGTGSAARFDQPKGVAVDSAGNIYVADYYNHTIRIGYRVAPAPQLANVSTRLAVGTGDSVLIGGFIITGTQATKIVIRAIGPSLTQAGVSGALLDPTLELYDNGGTLIARNDDWDYTQVGGIIEYTNYYDIRNSGFAPSNEKESAILAILSPGAYTAVVRGKNNATGIALVETYDLDWGVDSKLANISTRGFVQTGDSVIIGGTIIRGSAPASVVIRAIGPSLTNAGVPNALQDPTLELHDSNGALISFNDNWRDSQQAADITAKGLAPTSDLESAIFATLPPGAYTAIVRGKGNMTGVALVEAYELGN
jgi:hypothetical protein